ncbi:cysteine-rich KTR domain-containing protein [Oscillospiraceae bacterium CLA-AA-H272]|uniref:Cysteine-rich KTR domain-containing protein n=1 Tax=Brotocaccenecus cirricatena TaxID=3064195 RepID=A0AAE3DDT0_9FIRM|nr:cysteine-rich KTR domain-containing protein [Brotocaccenecus cirricatena]MCC2130383.1 cysteine-rich KTR domain-containing protein [Brotocaccenecus cirricatena]
MQEVQFIRCPVCGNKTRVQIRYNTELKNIPLFCPKCRQVSLINVTKFNMTVIKEPDA